jgi:hypothetical protein
MKKIKPIIGLILLCLIVLTGCFYFQTHIEGRVSTAKYRDLFEGGAFSVVGSKEISLTDKYVQDLIVAQMKANGFRFTDDLSKAEILVLYSYSIGPGRTEVEVQSRRSFVRGGTQVSSSSSTQFPRQFEIAIIDAKKTVETQKLEIIWQGEINSEGSSQNIKWLAKYFLEELFKNLNQTVTDQRFRRVVD